MNFLTRLFGKNEELKQCPRCLGKGHVDLNDIKRLNRELQWNPGQCAYCNGSGKVDSKIESTVPVDAAYLVLNLTEHERKKVINGHPDAIERGKKYEEAVHTFINQITYLHFEGRLTPAQIARFFLIGDNETDNAEKRQEMIDYIQRVIEKRSGR